MMISKEQVLKIAKLARLELTEKETEKMQKDLSEILDYFTLLKGVSRKRAKFHTEKRGNQTRKDVVAQKSSTLANNLIAASPKKKDDYIQVKQVLS